MPEHLPETAPPTSATPNLEHVVMRVLDAHFERSAEDLRHVREDLHEEIKSARADVRDVKGDLNQLRDDLREFRKEINARLQLWDTRISAVPAAVAAAERAPVVDAARANDESGKLRDAIGRVVLFFFGKPIRALATAGGMALTAGSIGYMRGCVIASAPIASRMPALADAAAPTPTAAPRTERRFLVRPGQ